MKKHFLFAALFLATLSIGFIACDNDDEPHLDNDDDNNENVVDIEGEEDYYTCDSTEMVCTGKAYEITSSSARVDATIHIPVVLMASAKFGVQISTNLHDLQDHTNVKNCATKNLTSNNFTVILKPLAPGTTYYYCAYIYMDDVYIYGLIREFKTLGESENGYGYVDLGLSSGLKWAACNVGAITPEEYGNYYAWGETTPKPTYSWSAYKWRNGSYKMTKYCTDSDYGTVDNKTVLDKEDDAAAVNMGGSWRMPTYDELYELKTKCTWTWTTQNSVRGYLVTSKTNGNSIFLPAAGCLCDGDSNIDVPDAYWSSSLYAGYSKGAYYLCFDSGGLYLPYYDTDRFIGRSVRGVCGGK